MKKKILLSILGIVLSGMLFAQTPVKTIRVANATTAIGINIPIGTQVYDIATQNLYIAITGVISTATLTSASSSFKLTNGNGTTNLAEGTATNTTVQVTSSTGTAATLNSATTSRAGLLSKAKYDSITSNTNTNIIQGDTLVAHNTRIFTNQSNISKNVDTLAVHRTDINTNTSKLATIETGAQVNFLTYQDVFEESTSTASTHTLTHTANTSYAPVVSLNGQVIPSTDYTFTSTSVTLTVPVAQYDRIVINYHY